MKNKYVWSVAYVFFISVCIATPHLSYAQTPCGDIIAPVGLYDISATYDPTVTETTPIDNCTDPFHKTTDTVSPYALHIESTVIHESDSVLVPEGGTKAYSVEGTPLLTGVTHAFFLHEGSDYRFIDTRPSEPQEADYRALATAFLPAGTDIELFVAAMTDRSLTYDMDEATQNLFWDYTDYVDQNFHPQLPSLHTGTYTLVSKEYELILVQKTILERLAEFFVPVAHAQIFHEYTFTVTFTVTEEAPVPVGISNILFLPGIQASRLYTEVDGVEEKLWEPGGDDDVTRLSMTNGGESIEDVYTRDVKRKEIWQLVIMYIKDFSSILMIWMGISVALLSRRFRTIGDTTYLM